MSHAPRIPTPVTLALTLVLAVAAGAGSGCAESPLLLLDVRSDLAPGTEVLSARTTITLPSGEALGPPIVRRLSDGDDLVAGTRIVETDSLSTGDYVARVELIGPTGSVVVSRPLRIRLRADLAVTVVMTRDCAAVSCAEEEGLAACFAGACVDAACSSADPDACGPPACTVDADCGGAAACMADAICSDGACFATPVADACEPGTTCDAELGCVPGSTPACADEAILDADIDVETTLPAGTCYRVTSAIEASAGLTIEPGVQMTFENGASLTLYDAIVARGTAEAPIVLAGAEALPGYWDKIVVRSRNPLNEIAFARIRHGGSDGTSLLVDGDARLLLRDTVIEESAGRGATFAGNAVRIDGFARNVFSACADEGLAVSLAHPGYLDAESLYGGEAGRKNGGAFVHVLANGAPVNALEEDATWSALDVPYRIGQVFQIAAELAIEPGTVIELDADTGLHITSGGALTARGTEDDRIVFRGARDEPGYHRGLLFGSTSPLNVLDHADISGGGSDGFFFSPSVLANIDVSGRLTLTNSTVADSAGYGVHRRGGTLDPEDPTTSGDNTFSSNVAGDLGGG